MVVLQALMRLYLHVMHPIIEPIVAKFPWAKHFEMALLREDLSHAFEEGVDLEWSGNKWRKLKKNLEEAKSRDLHSLITFGGAFSNHIAATAAAGKAYGFDTVGLIRGEPYHPLNPTLSKAVDNGMKLYYLSREQYRDRHTLEMQEWVQKRFGPGFLIPEGGSNELGVEGVEEMMKAVPKDYDYILCPVGTGATLAGIVNGMEPNQKALGISVLKNAFDLEDSVRKWVKKEGLSWSIDHDYHFGGYAKVTHGLVQFINNFKQQFDVLLDPVYTGKMAFAAFRMAAEERIPRGSKILMVHTGGQQGISGINMSLRRKGMQTIEV